MSRIESPRGVLASAPIALFLPFLPLSVGHVGERFFFRIASARARASQFIELFNTATSEQRRSLMDRRKGTHNGRTNRDSTSALASEGDRRQTTDRHFPAIFARLRLRLKTFTYLRLGNRLSQCNATFAAFQTRK